MVCAARTRRCEQGRCGPHGAEHPREVDGLEADAEHEGHLNVRVLARPVIDKRHNQAHAQDGRGQDERAGL
jgi:hypothetical protein